MTKHLIIGLGLVGKSFLHILKDQDEFDLESFFCIDSNPDALAFFTNAGGHQENFLCIKLTEKNYKELLHPYLEGDFIFDFSCEVKNLDLLRYSLDNNLHYISTADSNWDLNDPTWVSVHQHFLEYRSIARHRSRNAFTSIIEFGMNPGLVSCFAKKCLKMIIETDTNPYIRRRKERLFYLLSKGRYGKVARKIGLEYIIEVDHDNQQFNISPRAGCIYSPWNPMSFTHESLSAPEIIFGTWKQFKQFDKVRDCDFLDYYVSLLKHGCDCKERAFSPQGEIIGSLIPHEEIFSMTYFFRRGRYKPTSFFVYKPCDLAEQSLEANRHLESPGFSTIEKEHWKSGGESVGIILQGKRFNAAYFGNYLDGQNIDETATIRQVSASTYAAYKYIKKHPRDGFMFPEECNEEELSDTAKEFLGQYTFTPCRQVTPHFGKHI